MKHISILAALAMLMALAGCDTAHEIALESTTVQGPLKPFISVTNKTYVMDGKVLNLEFQRIGDQGAPSVTNPKLFVEFLDKDGAPLGKSESNYQGTSDENVGALLRLNPGDKSTLAFLYNGDRPGAIAKIRVSSDGVVAGAAAPAAAAPAAAPAGAPAQSVDASSVASLRQAQGGGGGSAANNFSYLASRRLNYNDIAGLSGSERRILRNAIYAMHGYMFRSADLRNYFSQFSWYRPDTPNEGVARNRMNSIERYNVDFIRGYE